MPECERMAGGALSKLSDVTCDDRMIGSFHATGTMEYVKEKKGCPCRCLLEELVFACIRKAIIQLEVSRDPLITC